MKTTFPVFVSLLFMAYFMPNNQKLKFNQYIEIKHVGVEEKIVNPLVIFTKDLNIEVEGGYLVINRQKVEKLTARDKFILSNGDYTTMEMDERTFANLSEFITKYPHYAAKYEDKKSLNYSIFINGKTYNVTYTQTQLFFRDLIAFLKTGNYEKNMVNKLAVYINNNFY